MEKTAWNGMKVILLAVLAGLIALLLWLCVRYLVPVQVLKLDAAKVTSITLEADASGDRQRVTLTEREDIEKLVSLLEEIRVKRPVFSDRGGYWGCGFEYFSITLSRTDGDPVEILLDFENEFGLEGERFELASGEVQVETIKSWVDAETLVNREPEEPET